MSGSKVNYRNPDEVLDPGDVAIPKGDAAGRAVVTGDADAPLPTTSAPEDLTAFGRVVYRTPAPTFYEPEAEIAAASRVVELLYVQLGKVLVNAIPLYLLVIDKNDAPAAGDGSALPIPKMAAAGDMIEWEPPGGFLFTTGIRAVVSTDPNVYAPPPQPEPISVTCRTRNP